MSRNKFGGNDSAWFFATNGRTLVIPGAQHTITLWSGPASDLDRVQYDDLRALDDPDTPIAEVAGLADGSIPEFYGPDDASVTRMWASPDGGVTGAWITTTTISKAGASGRFADLEDAPTVPTTPGDIGAASATEVDALDTRVGDAEAELGGRLSETSLSATFGAVGANVARFVQRARAGENLKIVALGDSILEGQTVTNPATDGTMLLLAADLSARFGVTVTQANYASSGFTALRAFTDGRVASAVAEDGDLYIVSAFDKNDIGAEANGIGGLYVPGYPQAASLAAIERMVRAIRERVPKADIIILTTNPYVAASSSNAYQDSKDEAVRRVAAAYGCELVDANAAFKALGDWDALLADSTHPNTAGHRLIADTVLAHLTNRERTPIMPGAPAARGLYAPEDVAADYGQMGTVVSLATGSKLSGSSVNWTNTGTWTGTGGSNAYTTTTAGSYTEVTGRFSEVHFMLSTALADALVADVTADGVVVATNQSFTLGKNGNYYVPVAVGLDPDVEHTVRLTLKSGSLKIQRMAALATGASGGGFTPETRVVDYGWAAVTTALSGSYANLIDSTLSLPSGWNAMDVIIHGYAGLRVTATTTEERSMVVNVVVGSTTYNSLTLTVPATTFDRYAALPIGFAVKNVTAASQTLRIRARVTSTNVDKCWGSGQSLAATLVRTA